MKFFFLHIYLGISCMYGAHRGHESVLKTLKLEKQTVLSHHGSEIKPRSSGRVVSIVNLRAISPASIFSFLNNHMNHSFQIIFKCHLLKWPLLIKLSNISIPTIHTCIYFSFSHPLYSSIIKTFSTRVRQEINVWRN